MNKISTRHMHETGSEGYKRIILYTWSSWHIVTIKNHHHINSLSLTMSLPPCSCYSYSYINLCILPFYPPPPTIKHNLLKTHGYLSFQALHLHFHPLRCPCAFLYQRCFIAFSIYYY